MDDIPDRSLPDHLPCLADHRIAGIAVGDSDQDLPVPGDLLQCKCLVQVQGERLVAEDMDPALHEVFCDLKVAAVGRHDRYEVDPVLPGRLRICHFLIVVIDTGPVYTPGLCRFQTRLEPAGKASRTQFSQVIHLCRMSVHVADIRRESPADHAVSELLSCARHFSSFFFLTGPARSPGCGGSGIYTENTAQANVSVRCF